MSVIECHTIETWNENYQKAKVAVYFMATWCEPCNTMTPIFADLASNYGNVVFLKVDIDELKTVATEWNVASVPICMFFKEGTKVGEVVGAIKDKLIAALDSL